MSAAPFYEPAKVRAALISLAWQQRKLARQYRAWSRGPGRPEEIAKWTADAARYAEDWRWHYRRALTH